MYAAQLSDAAVAGLWPMVVAAAPAGQRGSSAENEP